MKNILLVANIGNRDFQIPKELIENISKELEISPEELSTFNDPKLRQFRTITDKMSKIIKNDMKKQNFLSKHIEKLFPIITSYIDLINDLESDGKLTVLLFNTNQNDEKYNHSDTIFASNIIKSVFNNKYGQEKFWNKLETASIPKNPTDYSELIEYFERMLPKILSQKNPDLIYAGTTGGTPALNTSLLLSINSSGCENSILYKPQNENTAKKVSNIEKILDNLFVKKFLIDSFKNNTDIDFSLAQKYFYSKNQFGKSLLCEFLVKFSENKYQEMKKLLYESELTNLYNKSSEFLELIKNKNENKNLLTIMLLNIYFNIQQNRIIDLPLKIMIYLETMIYILVENKTGLKKTNSCFQRDILNKNQIIKEEFNQKNVIINNKILLEKFDFQWDVFEKEDWNIALNNSMPNFIIDLLILCKDDENTIANIKKISEIYSPLREFRNKIAHSIIDINELEKEIGFSKNKAYEIFETLTEIHINIFNKPFENHMKNIIEILKEGL